MAPAIESLNPVVRSIVEGKAPRPAVVAAARGVLPLPQSDLLEVLVAFARSDDAELSGEASKTLLAQDLETLESSLRSADIASAVLDYFADQMSVSAAVHEAVITNTKTPAGAFVRFAQTSTNGALL